MDSVLVCDVDNTIADTAAELVRRFGAPGDPADYMSYLPRYFETSQWPDIFHAARPILGSLEAQRILAAQGWLIYFVTDRQAEWATQTMDWLFAHGYWGEHVLGLTCGTPKGQVLDEVKSFGAHVVYVDDLPCGSVPPGVQVIPHARPWQAHGMTWDHIASYLRRGGL